MADRVTKVRLSLVAQDYIAGMEKAAKATRDVNSEAAKLDAQREVFDAVGKAALAVGTLAAAGVALAVAKYADFDKQMSAVQAATHETTQNMAALRDAALEAGADTVFSATEAASAIEELGKAGVSTADTLSGGLTGSLDLAAAGGLDVGRAAEVAASALTQFGLAGKDVPHVADVLAAGAGKAQGSVEDMSQALNQSGLVASQMGLSLEETVGSLSAFASAGLTGSDAGTSFRAALLRLANPTQESKQLMDELGIAAYDAGGQFVGMESLAGQLHSKLTGLTQAQRDQTLATLFGQDAIRAANVLFKEGAEGIAQWTAKVDDAGYAAETAEARMDNLAGDVEKLGGAFDTALIKAGSGANDALRAIVQTATAAVDAFAEAPDGVQQSALIVGGLTAAVSLAGGTFLLAVPKVAAFKAAVSTMGIAAQRTTATLSMMSKTVGVLVALEFANVLRNWASSMTGATQSASELQKQLEATKNSAETVKGALDSGEFRLDGMSAASNNLQALTGDFSDFNNVLADFYNGIGGGAFEIATFGTGDTSLGRAKTNISELDTALANMVASGNADQAAAAWEQLVAMTDGSESSLQKLTDLFPQYEAAQDGAAVATETTTDEVDAFAAASDGAKQSLDEFVDSLRNLGSTQLSLEDAQERVASSLQAFQKSLEENGQTLDVNTEAGRANRDAVQEIARAYAEQAAAQVEATGNAEDAIPVIQAGRDAVVNARIALGESEEAANAYADSLGLIPADVATQIRENFDEAIRKAEIIAQKIRDIPNSKEVYLYVEEQRRISGAPAGQVGAAYNANGGMYSYANGGFASGFYRGGTPLYKFAEPETRWEAFISGKQGQEDRNRAIALESYRRLGGEMGNVTNNYQFDVRTTDQDPVTQARVLGREFARAVAG